MPKTEPSAPGDHQNVESHPATKKQPLYGKELWGNDPHLKDKGADTGTGYDATKDPWTETDNIPAGHFNELKEGKTKKWQVR